MAMHTLFSDEDQERIRAAVADAEGRTSGEIVPVVVPQSASYPEAYWRGAVLSAAMVLALAFVVMQGYEGWGLAWLHSAWGIVLVIGAAGLLGAALVRMLPALRRKLAGAGTLDVAVHRRALQAFVEEEVFNTRERTGILILLSLFEHRIEVVGDAGINARVEAEDWVEVVEVIRTGIKQGAITQGLVEAITMCGHLLERSGVTLRDDDANELPDGLRIEQDRKRRR